MYNANIAKSRSGMQVSLRPNISDGPRHATRLSQFYAGIAIDSAQPKPVRLFLSCVNASSQSFEVSTQKRKRSEQPLSPRMALDTFDSLFLQTLTHVEDAQRRCCAFGTRTVQRVTPPARARARAKFDRVLTPGRIEPRRATHSCALSLSHSLSLWKLAHRAAAARGLRNLRSFSLVSSFSSKSKVAKPEVSGPRSVSATRKPARRPRTRGPLARLKWRCGERDE